ncbi:hypothetical protein SGCOL_007156 [Colletotrichum sp. CLE4]
MTTATLKNIAVIGGTGDLGHVIVNQLAAAGIFNLVVITRGSHAKTFPPGVKTVAADYESLDDLTVAFRGFDAVVCVVPGHLEALLLRILEAAIAAEVKRFIPSEFGSDHRNPSTQSVPLSASKIRVDEALKKAAAAGRIEYTSILGGPWIEWLMTCDTGMCLPKRKFYIHEDGDIRFGLSTRKAFGDAVVGVLKRPGATRNQILTIEVINLTQKRIVELVKEALPDIEIEVINVSTKERYERGVQKLLSGVFDASVIEDIVLRFVYDPELQLPFDTDATNELLGVQRMTEADFKQLVKTLA